jgi:hypothetical protein
MKVPQTDYNKIRKVANLTPTRKPCLSLTSSRGSKFSALKHVSTLSILPYKTHF